MPQAYAANENAHPNGALGQDSKVHRGPLAPTPSVSANFRSGLYVDSCDAGELDLGRKPISEVNESAGIALRPWQGITSSGSTF